MHSFFKFCIITLLVLLNTELYSQRKLSDRQITDSLHTLRIKIKVLKGEKGILNDSLRLELVNKMAVLFTKNSKDSALYFAESALEEAKSLRLKNVTAVSLYTLAYIYKYHKDFATSEKKYLEWMEVRKNQNDDEYRWALHELRKFYCTTREKEKLEKIEEEWLSVLDRQLDQGHISPWFDWEDGTPEENYQYSMEPVFRYLLSKGYYFMAEKSFLHMIQKCPNCSDEWSTGDFIYSYTERHLLSAKDTTTLDIWYGHWFNALEKYDIGKEKSLETYSSIAQGFTSGYFKYDQHFDKYYPLMMRYSEKIGGDSAVHEMLKTSSRRYVSALPVKIKINLFLLVSSIKVKDKENMENTYSQTDKLINDYISKGNSKPYLLSLLVDAKSRSKDKRYIKWCSKKIKTLS